MKAADIKRAVDSNIKYVFETANGETTADKVVRFDFGGDLHESIHPMILDETPELLSVGLRTIHHGYGFFWEPWSLQPIFLKPGSKYVLIVDPDDSIVLNAEDNVPIYVDVPLGPKPESKKLNIVPLKTGCTPALPSSSSGPMIQMPVSIPQGSDVPEACNSVPHGPIADADEDSDSYRGGQSQ